MTMWYHRCEMDHHAEEKTFVDHPESDTPFCADLPTSPRRDIGTVLVTGASGYIGGRLVPELLLRGYRVRAMVRGAAGEIARRWPQAEVVSADALDRESLGAALEGVDTAYYLIHSMLLGPREFAGADAADLKTGMKVRLVLRRITEEGSEGIICYGTKAVPA